MLNPLAIPFNSKQSVSFNPLEQAQTQLRQWNFSTNDQKLVLKIMNEWYCDSSLNSVLSQWEKNRNNIHTPNSINKPVKILSYNVHGWGTRALEVIDLVYRTESSIGIFTEVGELWNTNKIPHFNTFYQEGTNHSGGVCIVVGKNVKVSRIEIDIPNTVIIDIIGISEQIRIIGIYWPSKQKRDLDEILPFIVEGTIITGDFNATVKEWNSPATDNRGAYVRDWIEENNLSYIPSTYHSSKRSKRNIDLSFTNITNISCETIHFGSSDHRPLVLTCENIFFGSKDVFSYTNWRVYEAILVMLQSFWVEEQKKTKINEWYSQYVRFLSAVKNRLTKWEEKEKFKPSLPQCILDKLKEIRKIRNRYYHLRQKGSVYEESRVLLRSMTREVKHEISKYKAAQWQSFLSTIQQSYDNKDKIFWSYQSRIYKSRPPPLYKLSIENKVISDKKDITKELHKYYSEQFKEPKIDEADSHDLEVTSQWKEILKTLINTKEQLEKTNIAEVRKLIRSLKPKKSAGFDQVSNFMIKKLPISYIECLVICFNQWLNEGSYPDEWKLAKVITLNKLKAGIPKCEQTRPISLLATHSKLFEKLVLNRIKYWAETNNIVPVEQSGFRSRCLLATRVLSIYQEITNSMAANVPTLAIYVDYQKAYDRVWHAALVTKLWKLGMPLSMLKMVVSWLGNRKAYVVSGDSASDTFDINIGLPQGSSLSPYLFIVFHCDLIKCIGAHSGHLFADDLCVLIRPPLEPKLPPMMDYLEREGTKICNQIFDYARKWKQPINIDKTVAQLFYTQIKKPEVTVKMNGQKLGCVNQFKYLGFTWSSKLSLKPTVDRAISNIQKSLGKLKWLKTSRCISTKALRQCFFAYTFPHFAWLFPLVPILPESYQLLLQQKFRVGLRLVHRTPFISAHNLFELTKEQPLQFYVKNYIRKRLKSIFTTDLGRSLFYDNIFMWDEFYKRKNDHLGQFFRYKRVKLLISKHEPLILKWLSYIELE